MKKSTLKFLISFGIGTVLSLSVSAFRGLFSAENATAAMQFLSDGFFVSGMLFSGVGLLLLIGDTGFFDIFGYATKNILYLFTPFNRKDKSDFYEYKKRKESSRSSGKQVFLILSGLALFAFAVLFLILYYTV